MKIDGTLNGLICLIRLKKTDICYLNGVAISFLATASKARYKKTADYVSSAKSEIGSPKRL